MILTYKGVCDYFGYDKNDLAFLINAAKRVGIGKVVSSQKTEYSQQDLASLSKILQAWNVIYSHSISGLLDHRSTNKLQSVIIDAVINKELHFFSIFCPSYKKGYGAFGYNKTTGANTKRFILSIFSFLNDFLRTGINFDFNLYFSDLLLENYEKLIGTEYRNDLMENYNDLKSIIESSAYRDIIDCHLLSEECFLSDCIGEKGVCDCCDPTSQKILQQVYKRNLIFYRDKLGWSESKVLLRTETLACCYNIIGRYFTQKFSNLAIMFWTESAYERGRLYSGINQNDTVPIIYPKKI